MNNLSAATLVLLTCVLAGAACTIRPEYGSSSGNDGAPLTQPIEIVGRWVRYDQANRTWGDTLAYQGDGRVLGSTTNPVPASARWGVKTGPGGVALFCAGDAQVGDYCRTYRIEDGKLILDGGPSGPTVFRRVP
jgi:hypothetical protein